MRFVSIFSFSDFNGLLIAQLVERRTVVGYLLLSSGRWFDSGSADDYVFRMVGNATKYIVFLSIPNVSVVPVNGT